jgi:Arc/MetJ-type ribon-helix-helix transcriptional regulator
MYSDAVRSALRAIESARSIEEAKLGPVDRQHLAAALELLAIAQVLEEQICAAANST